MYVTEFTRLIHVPTCMFTDLYINEYSLHSNSLDGNYNTNNKTNFFTELL